ncbi:MAG: tetratricopeptide repeat protein [Myxococcales bacterium]
MIRLLTCLAVAAVLVLPSEADAKPRGKPKVEAKVAGSPADRAYQKAKDAYLALKSDAKRRRFRDQWLSVIEAFEAIAEKYPKSPRAAEALFNVAQLYADMSRVSLAKKDLNASMEAYRRLCERYPGSYLADDAHLALGSIYLDRKGDTEAARKEFAAAARCRGDVSKKAEKLLAALPPPPRIEKETAQAARPVPARPWWTA